MVDPIEDKDFEALLEHLRMVRGVDFTGYKRASLKRLVGRRMQASGMSTYASYEDYLEVDPGEFTTLFDTVLINVTGFFRDPESWRVLQADVLPGLLAALDPDAPVRLWSAACATGEEAYTLAIVLAELLGDETFVRRVKIYATDIDEKALAVARAGRYPRASLREVPAELVERYFTADGDTLTVRADLRSCVIFGRHDLLQDAPISRIQLLCCRNMLMYLNHEAQTRVLSRLAFGLGPASVLMLGRAELLLTHKELFTPIDLAQRLFRKCDPSESATARRAALSDAVLGRVAEAAFATAPEALIVVDDAGVLTLVNHAAVRMLAVQDSDVGAPLLDLTISSDPVDLREALETARKHRHVVDLKDQPAGGGAVPRWYDVQVVPLFAENEDAELLGLQVGFFDVTRFHELSTALDAVRVERQQAHRDLIEAHATMETTNEELQSAVEELETTNEEMQSANEELEMMNEELQSTNEELQYLNEALRERTVEVNQVNSFLESILIGLRGGVVVVDRELVVRVWNARAESMWGLRAHEAEGRHLLNLDIGLPVEVLRQALKTLVAGERDHVETTVPAINRFGRPVECSLSCSPLRDESGEVSGAIVVMEELAVG